ncbi:hypothetical protein KHP60_21130 [Microvirga sp. 3-52]|uniref:hypothetical protein n=1 Tax=Microvirga sp. 3-52 TaxID=2792425 RepID=UPI001AC148D3|nr:hypothetical protein [Microvirga sp. 3-52]MBO1907016.1 hypothetical protein [Microvirga sp. 3-52]MBS7454813.1 hypothetical protein [Microvirga sp. 3-52]
MKHIDEFVDERQQAWCIHCGGWIAELDTNRDHVPTKTLLHKPFPENLPVVKVCKDCNEGFSLDEQYLVAFLGSVLSGTTDPSAQSNPAASRILRTNESLRARIEQSKTTYRTISGETRHVWKPEQMRIDRVLLKNARGHAFFENGEPMLSEPDIVWSRPLETLTAEGRDAFEDPGDSGFWPEVGSRMMTRIMTGHDLSGGWVIVQEGVYRYSVTQDPGIRVRMVLSEYLAAEVCWD